jgi:hypothetical protein
VGVSNVVMMWFRLSFVAVYVIRPRPGLHFVILSLSKDDPTPNGGYVCTGVQCLQLSAVVFHD